MKNVQLYKTEGTNGKKTEDQLFTYEVVVPLTLQNLALVETDKECTH